MHGFIIPVFHKWCEIKPIRKNSYHKWLKLQLTIRYTQMFLEGRAAEIKAYTVATEVFGRNMDFDPRTDPIVSVEARPASSGLEALLSDSRQARQGANHHSHGRLCAVVYLSDRCGFERFINRRRIQWKRASRYLADSDCSAVEKFFWRYGTQIRGGRMHDGISHRTVPLSGYPGAHETFGCGRADHRETHGAVFNRRQCPLWIPQTHCGGPAFRPINSFSPFI